MKELEIIIVTYNSKEIIGSSLSEFCNSDKYDVIVVDNASTDGTAEYIIQNFPQVRLIRNSINQGYGRACNVGFKNSNAPYTLLLNPDVITNEANILKLLHTAKTLNNSVISAPVVDKEEHIEGSLVITEDVEWVVGAAMLFNMKLLREIGLFDENIFLYYEETDLCKRALSAGYKITKCKNILMNHLVGKSSIQNTKTEYLKYWHSAWSKFYYNRKHFKNHKAKNLKLVFKYALKKVIYSFANKNKLKYNARFAGAIAFIKGKPAFSESGKPNGL